MSDDFPIAIVGAGFSGLAMALACKRAGLDQDLVIFEAADRVGGTWRDNTYPGCACDVPSHLYHLRRAPNPDWSREYSEQPEILGYIERLAAEQGLLPHVRFNSRIQRAELDADSVTWTLTTTSGQTHKARALVLAPGPLARPLIPDLPGRDRFAGPSFHTQQWDHSVDLQGKRVAVVGTGASAIQVVPAIAPTVAHLDLYQRTPPWLMPRMDRGFTGLERSLFRHVPGVRWLYRNALFALRELVFAPALTRQGWVTRMLRGLPRRHLRRSVRDPELRARLTPSYDPGCKRIIVSDDFYPAVQRDNVHLIDRAVAGLTETGLIDADGVERPADVVVFATGFKATDYLADLPVIGADGQNLRSVWDEQGVQTLHGTCVAGFPNLFMLLGPNSGLGHNSVLLMAEAQVDYAVRCLRHIRDRGLRGLDVKPEAQLRDHRQVQEALQRTVWLSGCTSWYLTEDGENPTLWPDSVWAYQRRMARLDLAAYREL